MHLKMLSKVCLLSYYVIIEVFYNFFFYQLSHFTNKCDAQPFVVYWIIVLLYSAAILLYSENVLKPYVLIVCGPLTFPVFLPGRRSRGGPSSLPLSVSLSPASPCWLRDSVSDWTCDGVSEFWFSGDEEREGESRKRFMAGWLNTDGSLFEAWKQIKSVINC